MRPPKAFLTAVEYGEIPCWNAFVPGNIVCRQWDNGMISYPEPRYLKGLVLTFPMSRQERHQKLDAMDMRVQVLVLENTLYPDHVGEKKWWSCGHDDWTVLDENHKG